LERFLPWHPGVGTEQRSEQSSRHTGLQIEEDLLFLQREWKVQRIGWFLLSLAVLAAALGLFGRGFLSRASASTGGLHLRYERLERFQRPTSMQLRISATAEQTTSLLIERRYLDAIRIERIMPEPEQAAAHARGLIYHFASHGEPITITFHLQLERFGLVSGQIGLLDGPMLSFNQFVFP